MNDPKPSATARRWQLEKQGGHEYIVRPASKTRWVFVAVAGMLALAGGLGGLLSWLTPVPRPTLVALWIGQYHNNSIPLPSLASQDQQAILASGLFRQVIQPSATKLDRHIIVGELTALKDHSAHEPVVVYLSGHACLDKNGSVAIFAADSDPDAPSTRLPLRTVLKCLADCPARHKLLVLDIMQPLADAQLGVLADNVANAIEQNLNEVPDNQRLVLCACSPGQVALVSEAAGRSIFNLYFEEGLRGWADGWGPQGSRDGWVTVHELAAFVQGRVDRWAHHNRNLRQTPVLYGTGVDFNLASFEVRETPGHVADQAAPAYPAALKEAWKQHEQVLADGSWRWTPRDFRQQTAWLLKSEHDWRGGLDAGYLQSHDLAQVQAVKSHAAKTRRLPLPEPQSVALALAFGDGADKEATKSLQEFYAKLRTMKLTDPARAKSLDEFTEKFAKFPPLARAAAVVQQASLENQPTFERIAFLDSLVEPDAAKRPRFVETLLLKRLTEMGNQINAKNWPTDIVRQVLQTAFRGEAVTSQYEVHSWNSPVIAEADRLRHDGEVLFWARGFAAPAEADKLLALAAAKYAVAQSRADVVLKACVALDNAFWLLPSYLPYLEHAPDSFTPWLDAVRTAGQLHELLHGPSEDAEGTPRKIDGIVDATEQLETDLTALRQPFEAEQITVLLRRSKLAKADPIVIAEIHALLNTPFLKAEERALLCQACYDLEQRLHQQTLRIDREEDETSSPAEPLEEPNEKQAILLQMEHADRLATASISLLELAGLPHAQAAALLELQKLARQKSFDASSLGKLSDQLAQAWSKQLQTQYQGETSLWAKDRLTRLLPPLEFVPLVDDSPMSLPVQIRQRESKALWARLGENYRYQSRDFQNANLDWAPLSSGERFYAQAALAYLPQPINQNSVSMTGGNALPRLSPNRTNIECPLQLEWGAGKGSKDIIDVRIENPDPAWLTIEPKNTKLRGAALDQAFPLSLTGKLLLDIRLAGDADARRSAPPRGFLVQADLDGLHYHFKVPVPIQTAPDQPHLLLSTNKEMPNPVLSEIRLRPGKTRLPVYLYARNPGDTARKVTIEIRADGSAIKGGTITKVLPPQSTERLDLGEPAPLPATDLPPFTGPLQWRVIDPDRSNDVLDEQSIPVVVATPRDYVRVANILFAPATQETTRNRLALTVQVFAPPGGPDMPVELVLPADRIPGLVGIGRGTLRGELAANGDKDRSALVLNAEKIGLVEGEDEEGAVYLNVDGYDRAFLFKTVFARNGAPTTPRADLRPAVRVRGERFTQPNPKFGFTLEVDNPPDGATLELTVGQFSAGEFRPSLPAKAFPTAKRHYIGFSPTSPGGGFVFEGTLADWFVPLDTSRLLGKHDILVRMLDRNGKEISKTLYTFVVDDGAPLGGQFVGTPKAAKRGTKVLLQASALNQEVGIKEALFFLGKPVEGKVPQGAATLQGTPANPAKTLWQAELLLPEDKKGATEISVQFTNQGGRTSFATASIDLVDGDPAKMGPGKIKGKVVMGELAQADLFVSLRDEKGAEKAKAKTKVDGSFLFEDVAPGRYSVYCRKDAAQRHGTATAVVQANQVTEVTVNLTLRVTK